VSKLRAALRLALFLSAWLPALAFAQFGSLVVVMTAPDSGATVSGSIPVSASVTILGAATVVGVQFKLDGANLGAEDTSWPYAITWNTSGAANGSHTLTAVARDFFGGHYTSAPVTVTVANSPPPDTTQPNVSISAPAGSAKVSGTVSVNADASDNVGVVGVQFQMDGAPLGAEDTAAPYSVSWNTAGASNGSHTLTAVARDAAGNTRNSAAVTVLVDNSPPSVSISAPVAGAILAGTVSVSATASDNVGLVGVQFKLDGANLGAEDMTGPYAVSWNTAGASDGSHTLTAVARDEAGNSRTSAPVTVTVTNAPPPQAQRFEETDASVSFDANWSAAPARSWSAGGAAATATAGAQATLTFTGTSVAWVGGRATGTGIARVLVDGVFVAEVDTYSKTEEIRVSMFGISGLAAGNHTLTIEATGRMNAAAVGALVVVDAFDVPAPATSRLQETDPDIAYSAGWMAGDPSRPFSGGTATLSQLAGAQATLTFNGTKVSWIGARGPQTGIARVSVDGAAPVDVDTYAATEQIQAEVFVAANLADTQHTLSIQATGLANGAASASVIVIDGFEVTAPGFRVQETNPAIAYSAGWAPDNRDKAYSEGISAESNVTGAQATFTFVGTGVRWIGARGPQTGMARVFLDGVEVADIDTFALTEGPQHTDYAVTGLARTTHTLHIQIAGKNPAATNAWVLIDAFDVIP